MLAGRAYGRPAAGVKENLFQIQPATQIAAGRRRIYSIRLAPLIEFIQKHDLDCPAEGRGQMPRSPFGLRIQRAVVAALDVVTWPLHDFTTPNSS